MPARPLTGSLLIAAGVLIGLGNFLVVLDTTIANVSVSTIAGSLGVSSSQGTWVITSYAVAEAITVPLTGFLAKRFGAQRVFLSCYLAFALVSLLCGLSSSMGMLLGSRVLLGLVGGPIMPLSQMLLLRIFPKEKATFATVLWAMTTLIGPVAGPILGGIICDNYGWSWIFFIKVPIAACGGHSQGWEPLAGEMAAFVARLRAAAGANAAFEQQLATQRPSALYAGFVCDELARHVNGRGEVVGEGCSMDLLRRERQRLVEEGTTEWAAGQALAAQLG